MQEGAILDFIGSWSSGLALLVVQEDDGTIHIVPCDTAPTVRALAAAFPDVDVAGPGHTVNVAALRGRRICYGMDGMGLVLGWLAPA